MNCAKIPVGDRFGSLVVIGDANQRTSDNRIRWLMKCDCGNEKAITAEAIKRGATISCGCVGKANRSLAILNGTRKLTKEQKDDAVERYINGDSSLKIAKHYGMNDSSIRSLLYTRNVPRRNSSESQRKIPLDQHVFDFPSRERDYWCGFLAADGCVTGRAVSVALHPKDVSHLHAFKSFLKSGHAITTDKRGMVHFQFNSPAIIKSLASLGIVPRKSLTFSPHESHLSNTDFWRGMIDGDGCLEIKKTGQVCISLVGSLPCVSAFADWCRQFSQTKATVRRHKSIYSFGVNGAYSMPIVNKLYADAPVALERKLAIYNRII